MMARWEPNRTHILWWAQALGVCVRGVGLHESAPARKPLCHCPLRFQRQENYTPKSSFTVDEDAFVVAEIAQFVRLDFVFLGFVVIDIAFASTVTP